LHGRASGLVKVLIVPFQETIMRSQLIAIVAAVISFPLAAVAEQESGPGSESLGSQLLEGLAPTSKPVAEPAVAPGRSGDASFVPRSSSPAPNSVSLARVQQGMQNAQDLLARRGADGLADSVKVAGTVQQQVVTDLDKLIAELSKQCNCQGGQCDKPGKPDPSSKSKPGTKPAMAAGTGKSAARESSDRLDRTTAKPVDKGDAEGVVKALWGHLPERAREQMMQSFSAEFLPKYQLEIEQYYRKLGEEQGAARE